MLENPYTIEVFEPFDDLLERRRALSFTTEINDMQTYAAAWLKLAGDFEDCGLVSNASYCRSRGNHYASMTGAYNKVADGCIVELAKQDDAVPTN